MVKLLIKKLNKEVIVPEYKTKGSSGMDIAAFIVNNVVIKPGCKAIIPTGLRLFVFKEMENPFWIRKL